MWIILLSQVKTLYFLYNNDETHFFNSQNLNLHFTFALNVKLSDPASFTASTLYFPWSIQDSIDTLNESCPFTFGINVKRFVLWNIVTLEEGKLSTMKVKSNRPGAVIVLWSTSELILGLSEKFKASQFRIIERIFLKNCTNNHKRCNLWNRKKVLLLVLSSFF